MKIEKAHLKFVFNLHNKLNKDERGFFKETFNQIDFIAVKGSDIVFVQVNQSRSVKGVLRGLFMPRADMEVILEL